MAKADARMLIGLDQLCEGVMVAWLANSSELGVCGRVRVSGFSVVER